MTEKELIKNLYLLGENIQPQGQWKEGLKNRALSQLESRTTSLNEAGFFVAQNFASIFGRILQPAVITLALLGFVGVNSLGLALAKNSLPGSFLYRYKTTNEKIIISLIQSPERKISLKASFAGERLKEFSKLAKTGKAQEVYLLASDFHTNLDEITTSFVDIKETSNTDKLVKLAFILDAQTSDYENILNEANKDGNLSKETKDELKKFLAQADKANSDALKLVVEKYNNNETEVSEDKLALRLKSKIERVENLIESGDLPILDEKVVLAKKSLAEAKTYLEAGNFSMALDKADESKKIIQQENVEPAPVIIINNNTDVQPDNSLNTETSKSSTTPEKVIKEINKVIKPESDFKTDLINENKNQVGFFGGLIKSRR